jgi:hypothetical protein
MLEDQTTNSSSTNNEYWINETTTRKRGPNWRWSLQECNLIIDGALNNMTKNSMIDSFRSIGSEKSINAITVRYNQELNRVKRRKKHQIPVTTATNITATNTNFGRMRHLSAETPIAFIQSSISKPPNDIQAVQSNNSISNSTNNSNNSNSTTNSISNSTNNSNNSNSTTNSIIKLAGQLQKIQRLDPEIMDSELKNQLHALISGKLKLIVDQMMN